MVSHKFLVFTYGCSNHPYIELKTRELTITKVDIVQLVEQLYVAQ
jgi:hypothetical protein